MIAGSDRFVALSRNTGDMRLRASIPLAALAMLLPGNGAGAAATRDLWATVNLCNTPQHPNMMGVRGSMPGDGKHEKMYMRFTAEFRAADKSWKRVGGTGLSRWIYAGSALFSSEESGFNFSIDAPNAGDRFVLRGVAEFQWRAKRRVHGRVKVVVVRRATAITSAGHPSPGSEPAGYSSAACVITG
jgi:hypothetical protein